MLATALACLLWLHELFRRFLVRQRGTGYRRVQQVPLAPIYAAAKPAWVRQEIIRLKALMPLAGCRTISITFNRLFAAKRRVTVGKTFVSNLIRRHRYEVEAVRRHIKNRRPRPVPKNFVWAMDLTGKSTIDGDTQFVLGILEHASRAALWLEALPNKSSWALIVSLVSVIKRYGKPRTVRTDNEAVFASHIFRAALFFLGIHHRRTDLGCPWQNGRVERFFGTLKEKLDRLSVDSLEALNRALGEFRFFYNHVRPHQNLRGRTPAEAWAGAGPFTRASKHEYWFEAWDGLLSGYYLRR